MTFEVGEKVVYPNQGVGTIESISTREFGSQFERFYHLRLVYSSMTVMVPFSNVENVGLRRITKAAEINKVLQYLSSGACLIAHDWKLRFKINSEKMQSGDLLHIAEVFKALLRVQLEKPLSFRERKMLDRARLMLVSEISIARGISDDEALVALERVMQKTAAMSASA